MAAGNYPPGDPGQSVCGMNLVLFQDSMLPWSAPAPNIPVQARHLPPNACILALVMVRRYILARANKERSAF
jgi:hypothetical protein